MMERIAWFGMGERPGGGWAAALMLVVLMGCQSVSEAEVMDFSERVKVHELQDISEGRDYYHGWGTVFRTEDGTLFMAYSGGREGHICPYGRVELIRSEDDGQTWSEPEILFDSPTDDRDSAIMQTAEGTLLVSWFTSHAWRNSLEWIERQDPVHETWYAPPFTEERLAAWGKVRDAMPEEYEDAHSQGWIMRSEDGGRTWSEPYRVPMHSPHGAIQLEDGRLLFAGRHEGAAHVFESTDDGWTWDHIAEIPVRPGDEASDYHELHAVETADGRIIAQIRNHSDQDHRYVLQTVSEDGGHTWSVPESTGIWGFPTHLLRLADNRILMTYGHRESPYSIHVRMSEDHGRSWSDRAVLYDQAARPDMGYPSTVSLGGNQFLTIWYQSPGVKRYEAFLHQARWELVEGE